MAAILAANMWKKLTKSCTYAKVLCAKFGYKRADSLGGDSGQTDGWTDKTKSMPLCPNGPYY